MHIAHGLFFITLLTQNRADYISTYWSRINWEIGRWVHFSSSDVISQAAKYHLCVTHSPIPTVYTASYVEMQLKMKNIKKKQYFRTWLIPNACAVVGGGRSISVYASALCPPPAIYCCCQPHFDRTASSESTDMPTALHCSEMKIESSYPDTSDTSSNFGTFSRLIDGLWVADIRAWNFDTLAI